MSADFFDAVEESEAVPPPDAPCGPVPAPPRIVATGWGFRADRIVRERLKAIAEAGGRYQDCGRFLETNATGEGFYLERGGFWNNPERASLGVTKADVAETRAALRRIGIKRSLEEVEAVLARALREAAEPGILSKTEDFALDIREYWRRQAQAKIGRRREAGLCIECGREAVAGDRATCTTCNEKRVARRRRRSAA